MLFLGFILLITYKLFKFVFILKYAGTRVKHTMWERSSPPVITVTPVHVRQMDRSPALKRLAVSIQRIKIDFSQ